MADICSSQIMNLTETAENKQKLGVIHSMYTLTTRCRIKEPHNAPARLAMRRP